MDQVPKGSAKKEAIGTSPVGRGGAGTYIEGELGAFYLLQMLGGSEARGLPDARIGRVQFQGENEGYALDDLIIHGLSEQGSALLEIQSKRTITFAPKDTIFESVCKQIVKSAPADAPTDRHFFAAATQRTSFAISGPYQDVLEWARTTKDAAEFFTRLALKGVASEPMRTFVQTFRSHLTAAGLEDNDGVIWDILRRFLIIEFDFESGAPQARTHALMLAGHVLAPEDAGRGSALWGNLIELVIQTGKTGGSFTREELATAVTKRGFRLAGIRDFTLARARLAEMSRQALKDIGQSVGGITLPRLGALAAVEKARDGHRFVEITGKPGVGKSWLLRHLAERQGREGHVVVLDPIGTPDGGWSALAQRLAVPGTAKEFLSDLAASGGGVLFIDGVEMFVSDERCRTVNDVVREVAEIEGFSVVISSRPDADVAGRSWLAKDALSVLGAPEKVLVGELDEDEVAVLRELAPELRALLSPTHPAATIARNLYRLTQLLKIPSSVDVRSEAALADHWWQSGDGARPEHIRAAQRILAGLADAALSGRDVVNAATDSPARDHLLRSLTLSEPRRDKLAFHHDVLRDWAVGMRLWEERSLLDGMDLTLAPSPRLARGVEFAARFALEKSKDGAAWQALLAALSPNGAHDAWRRQALLAVVRSEVSAELLNRCAEALLANGGALLNELSTAIVAVETTSVASLFAEMKSSGLNVPEGPTTLRAASTRSAPILLMWCVDHETQIPIQAIGAVVKLVEIQFFLAMTVTAYEQATAKMLFSWLTQLDLRSTEITIPTLAGVPKPDGQARHRMIEDLRMMTLMLATHAPDEAKAYLTAAAQENGFSKAKDIRSFSRVLAAAAPAELAALVENSLIERPVKGRRRHDTTGRGLSFADTDYMMPSPAQPPFLDLLDAAPEIGLALIRKLVAAAVAFHAEGKTATTNGYTVMVDGKPRFFPWFQTYFWARGQAREYSVTSGLMALEAWAQERLDKGEDLQAVLHDVLGPDGGCAAYLLIAVDLLLSHWPASREALVPFLASPGLLANERTRVNYQMLDFAMPGRKEPAGRIKLDDLAKRPSRRITLEQVAPYYLADDEPGRRLRVLLAASVDEHGPYEEGANFGDAAFIGAHVLNMLDAGNWVDVEGGRIYRSPQVEADHIARLEEGLRGLVHSSNLESRIHLATNDPAKGSAELAREAVAYGGGDLPDDSDTDALKTRSTRLAATAMLAARDGDDALLAESEGWVRRVIAEALKEEVDRYSGSDRLEFNRPALGLCALIHLWHRRRLSVDRDALVEACARPDRAAIPAFAAAQSQVTDADPRLIKSAVRMAFSNQRWRWHPYEEEPSAHAAYKAEKARLDTEAVAAEIAWLDGGPEPAWPELPEEKLALRRSSRMTIRANPANAAASEVDEDEDDWSPPSREPSIHIDTQGIAKWLALLNVEGTATPAWYIELIDAYAFWSARLNAHGYPAEVELDRAPDEWNRQFYILHALALMDLPQGRFEQLLQPILELPDHPFCDVVETLMRAADVRYFNDRSRPADRVCEVRTRLVTRMIGLDRWSWHNRAGDLGVDYQTGPAIATLLMNAYDTIRDSESYLVPAVFERVDPLLDTLRPILSGGPIAFIALCTMNTLLVATTPRHLDFLLFATETWFEVMRSDPVMWRALSIGQKIALWLEQAAVQDPSLFRRDHIERARIDAVLGRLVSVGISEAHEIEKRIEAD